MPRRPVDTRRLLCVLLLSLFTAGLASPAYAASGPLGIDHRLAYDNAGIWKRSVQEYLLYGMVASVGAGALWEGGENRFGRTLWQSVDAAVFSGAAAFALKFAFSRERPIQTPDPNHWFTGRGNDSFPSGDVTITSSLVTPFVLEYAPQHPAMYALELVPIYDAFARMKTWGHWQTDVLAGFALGTAAGYFLHRPSIPLVLSVMPHFVYIGLSKRF